MSFHVIVFYSLDFQKKAVSQHTDKITDLNPVNLRNCYKDKRI